LPVWNIKTGVGQKEQERINRAFLKIKKIIIARIKRAFRYYNIRRNQKGKGEKNVIHRKMENLF